MAQKTFEKSTLTSLLEYARSSAKQEKKVICRATVASINTRNGWNYVACGRCSKKLVRGLSSFTCTTCNDTNAIGVLTFRVDLVVVDAGEKTNFVIFDRDTRKLTNTTAEDINEARAGDNGSNRNNIPPCITDLVGKTMDFQVKITNFNFKSSFQSFTVSRVLREINRSHAEEVITEEILNPNLSDLTYNINDIEKESIPVGETLVYAEVLSESTHTH
ncbi:unnamed protein product, partial [Thlaspi arvense]